MEVETHGIIAERMRYIDADSLKELLGRTNKVGRLLNGLLRHLMRRDPPPATRGP